MVQLNAYIWFIATKSATPQFKIDKEPNTGGKAGKTLGVNLNRKLMLRHILFVNLAFILSDFISS